MLWTQSRRRVAFLRGVQFGPCSFCKLCLFRRLALTGTQCNGETQPSGRAQSSPAWQFASLYSRKGFLVGFGIQS
jgi:hypothetical protein